jgi:hypothetical protein
MNKVFSRFLLTSSALLLVVFFNVVSNAQTTASDEESGVYVEFKGYVLSRFSENNDAYTRSTYQTNSLTNSFNSNETETTEQFNPGLDIAPKITIGVKNSAGLGLRGSYFFLQQRAEEQANIPSRTTSANSFTPTNYDVISSARAFDTARFTVGYPSSFPNGPITNGPYTANFRNDLKLGAVPLSRER